MKERDLTYELGRQNWIDALAGEAVVLGFTLRKPELEMMGTSLASLVREVPYNNDNFSKVIGLAQGLETKIKRVLEAETKTIYIEEIYEGESLPKRNSRSWEYDFVFSGGQYQILMILPVFQGNEVLLEEKKKLAEAAVCGVFGDSSFESYEKQIIETDYVTQKYITTSYVDEKMRLLRRITRHDHEQGYFEGWHEMYFFDDFATANEAWKKVRSIVTEK